MTTLTDENPASAQSRLTDGLGTMLTLSNENGEYSIRLRAVEMNIEDIFVDLITPVLLAAGYSNNIIEDYLHGDA